MSDSFVNNALSFYSKYEDLENEGGYTLYMKDGKYYLPSSDRKSFEERMRIYTEYVAKENPLTDLIFINEREGHRDDPTDVAFHLGLPKDFVSALYADYPNMSVKKITDFISFDDELVSPSFFDPNKSLYDVLASDAPEKFELTNCLLEHGIYLTEPGRVLNDPYGATDKNEDRVIIDTKIFEKKFFKSIDPAKVILGYVDDPVSFVTNVDLYMEYMEPLSKCSVQKLFDMAFNDDMNPMDADGAQGSVIYALRNYLNNFIFSLLNDYYKSKTGHGEKDYLYNYQKYASENVFNEYDHVYIGSRFTMYSRTSYNISHTKKGLSAKRIRHEYAFANSDRERLKTAYNSAKNIFEQRKKSVPVYYIPQVFLALMGVPYPAFKVTKYFSFDKATADDFVNLFEFIKRPEKKRFSFVETRTLPDVYINSLVKSPAEMKVFTHIPDDMFIVEDDFFDDETFPYFWVEDKEKYRDLIEGKDASFLIDQWLYTKSLDRDDIDYERESQEMYSLLNLIETGELPPFETVMREIIDTVGADSLDDSPDQYRDNYLRAVKYMICGYIITKCDEKDEYDSDYLEPHNYTYHDPKLPIKDFVPSEHGIVFVDKDRLYYQRSSSVFLEPLIMQAKDEMIRGCYDEETLFSHLTGLPYSYYSEKEDSYSYTDISLRDMEGYGKLIKEDPRLSLSEKKRELKEKGFFKALAPEGLLYVGSNSVSTTLSYGDEEGHYMNALEVGCQGNLVRQKDFVLFSDDSGFADLLEHEKDVYGNTYTIDPLYDEKINMNVLPGRTFIAYQDDDGSWYLDEDDIQALVNAVNLSKYQRPWGMSFNDRKYNRLNLIGMSPVFYKDLLRCIEENRYVSKNTLKDYLPFRKVEKKSMISNYSPFSYSTYFRRPFISTQLRNRCLSDNVLILSPFKNDVRNSYVETNCNAIIGEKLSDFASFFFMPDDSVFNSYLNEYFAICEHAENNRILLISGELIQAVYFKNKSFIVELLNAQSKDGNSGFTEKTQELIEDIKLDGIPRPMDGSLDTDVLTAFSWLCSLALTFYLLYSKKRIDKDGK